jgi:hypothetical protein
MNSHDETPKGKTLQFPGAASSRPRHDKTSKVTTGVGRATQSAPSDPDLDVVVKAWDTLPTAVRAGILAMVKASKTD